MSLQEQIEAAIAERDRADARLFDLLSLASQAEAQTAMQQLRNTIMQVMHVVCRLHEHITIAEMTGPSRMRIHAEARHMCAWLLYQMGMTHEEIAKALRRDRTTIYNSIYRGHAFAATDRSFHLRLQACIARLGVKIDLPDLI